MSEHPQNDSLAVEQAVLGAVLLNSECLDVIEYLEPRDFSLKRHEEIFAVMKYLHENDDPVDIMTITAHFAKHKKKDDKKKDGGTRLDDIGGVSYLSDLAKVTPTAANVGYYAEAVRSQAHRRRSKELARKIEAAADDDYETDEEFFATMDELVDELRPKVQTKMRSFKESRGSYFEHLKSKAAKLLTGVFKQFDDWAMLWLGWLYIIAGRPGVGKTAKALQLAYGIAKNNPDAGPVLIYSQEMDENEVKDRIVSSVAGINYKRLCEKGGPDGFTEHEWKKINDAYDELEKLKIYVQDSAGVTINEINATARRFKKKYGRIAAIIVDYLQIMEIPMRKNENRSQAIGRVTRTAKTMARQMKFCFIMLSQMTRESEERKEPKLSDLKESGSIEQDADVVEFLWWDGELKDNVRVVQSIFAKGRNIGLNRFRYLFKYWFQKYEEIEKKKAS
jgi:replicative DNA helicase